MATTEDGISKSRAAREDLAYDSEEEAREKKYGAGYKWVVLSNTTLGATMAAIDSSIVLISLPEIFSGLGVNPLVPGNIGLLLWMLLGYLIVTSVCVVAFGRLSDMFGRVRLYNLGFLIFAAASVLIYASSYLVTGAAGALSIIMLRLLQAVGGSFLFANSAALLTDAFPHTERGMALGINGIAFAGGSIVGLIIGGFLAAIDWHLVFMISVPIGVAGAIWSYLALHEIATIKTGRKLDVPGSIVFGVSLALLLIALTYALLPYGTAQTGWTNPVVLASLTVGAALMALFVYIELHARDPMFKLDLFRNRSFAAGNISMVLAGIARGGLQFMLVIWLQGIWLPQHGVEFAQTPLLAAIYMLPLTFGVLVAGPIFGKLSDKHGVNVFATSGMVLNAACFLAMLTLPVEFALMPFMIVTFLLGVGQGMFVSPNTAAVMNAVPPEHRGAAAGMRAALQNVSYMFSIIIFFSLLIIGLGATLHNAVYGGLVGMGVSNSTAAGASDISPTGALFAAFLGYNPLKTIIPAKIFDNLTASQQSSIASTSFFPKLISPAFQHGIAIVLYLAIGMSLVAAVASSLRGRRSIYGIENEER
jgi:MFS family permease